MKLPNTVLIDLEKKKDTMSYIARRALDTFPADTTTVVMNFTVRKPCTHAQTLRVALFPFCQSTFGIVTMRPATVADLDRYAENTFDSPFPCIALGPKLAPIELQSYGSMTFCFKLLSYKQYVLMSDDERTSVDHRMVGYLPKEIGMLVVESHNAKTGNVDDYEVLDGQSAAEEEA